MDDGFRVQFLGKKTTYINLQPRGRVGSTLVNGMFIELRISTGSDTYGKLRYFGTTSSKYSRGSANLDNLFKFETG
jgi:hypothetical protein